DGAPAAAAPPATPAPKHDEDEHARSSPLVRKIARENNVDLSQVEGTGLGGRITKQDILTFIENGASAQAPTSSSAAYQTPAQSGQPASEAPAPVAPPRPADIPGDLVPMSRMRQLIAKHMIESRRTSAHVHAMFEVDLTRIVNIRNKNKAAFEQRNGARLTFMPFFVRAAIIALQQFPIVNASTEGDNIRYHRHVNVGIAVALD